MSERRFDIKYRYSNFSVDRKIDKSKVIKLFNDYLLKCSSFKHEKGNDELTFFYNLNNWENTYFGIISVHIQYIDFVQLKLDVLKQGIQSFLKYLKNKFNDQFIITTEVPSEDIDILQILNDSRFRMVETRLHFFNNQLPEFNFKRFKVRDAEKRDLTNLRKVATIMRNKYDRFHADWNFDNDVADNYISTYIENSINGFADIVIVPNQAGIASDSFLTAKTHKEYWGKLDYPISQMVLSSVSAETNKGWYVKLIAEMTFRLRELGAQSIFMTTQSTNIPVLVTWQKHNYKIGRSTHVLSLHSSDIVF